MASMLFLERITRVRCCAKSFLSTLFIQCSQASYVTIILTLKRKLWLRLKVLPQILDVARLHPPSKFMFRTLLGSLIWDKPCTGGNVKGGSHTTSLTSSKWYFLVVWCLSPPAGAIPSLNWGLLFPNSLFCYLPWLQELYCGQHI